MEEILDGIPGDKLKWVAVDLDGTLAESIWPTPGIGKPISGAREAMEKITENGLKVVVYTARPWSHYEMIENWLIDNLIPFRRIICGKPLFKWVIDDKNIEFKGDWEETIKKI